MSPLEPQNPVIGKTIKSLREEAGLTQEELAHASGLNTSEISNLERGRRNPRWETMKRLANGLRVSCADMVARAERFEQEELEPE
jgi:transcriptional regulator with XRE-family HTH domain